MPRRPGSEPEFLYLTTMGRRTGLPREIEIWFVSSGGKFYVFAEGFHRAQWVKNIASNAHVRVRVGAREFEGTARALDQTRDADAWAAVQNLARKKYGWGDGLPVEIAPPKDHPAPDGPAQEYDGPAQRVGPNPRATPVPRNGGDDHATV